MSVQQWNYARELRKRTYVPTPCDEPTAGGSVGQELRESGA